MGNDWSKWGAWGTYDVTCGLQTRMRSRTCLEKIPWLKCNGDSLSMDTIMKYPCSKLSTIVLTKIISRYNTLSLSGTVKVPNNLVLFNKIPTYLSLFG